MKTSYIITSYIEGGFANLSSIDESDFVICADGGYEIALSQNIMPDIVIGDSDSGKMQPVKPGKTKFIHHEKEKDESDTFLCVKHAVELGFKEITILGGIGGRLDHTISNIQTLAHFTNLTDSIFLKDEGNLVTVIENSKVALSKTEGFALSLFSLSDKCSGVTVKGLKYPLKNAELNNSYPIGLSNGFIGDRASIEVKNGKLLIVLSKE